MLWKSIPYAIELSGFQRFERTYGDYLQHMISGTITNEELKRMQERQFKKLTSEQLAKFQFGTTIVQRNALRQNINDQYAIKYAETVNRPLYYAIAHDSTHQKNVDMNELRKQNAHRTEMKTSDLPHSIPLVIGLQYLITTNLVPEIELAKGTRCTLVQFIGNPNDPIMLEMTLDHTIPAFQTWPHNPHQHKPTGHFIIKRIKRGLSFSYKCPYTVLHEKLV
jgi:hypothetical protein